MSLTAWRPSMHFPSFYLLFFWIYFLRALFDICFNSVLVAQLQASQLPEDYVSKQKSPSRLKASSIKSSDGFSSEFLLLKIKSSLHQTLKGNKCDWNLYRRKVISMRRNQTLYCHLQDKLSRDSTADSSKNDFQLGPFHEGIFFS